MADRQDSLLLSVWSISGIGILHTVVYGQKRKPLKDGKTSITLKEITAVLKGKTSTGFCGGGGDL